MSIEAMQAECERLIEAEREAASIVCHRISAFGFHSEEVRIAHAEWRKAWCSWADAFDARMAAGRKAMWGKR